VSAVAPQLHASLAPAAAASAGPTPTAVQPQPAAWPPSARHPRARRTPRLSGGRRLLREMKHWLQPLQAALHLQARQSLHARPLQSVRAPKIGRRTGEFKKPGSPTQHKDGIEHPRQP